MDLTIVARTLPKKKSPLIGLYIGSVKVAELHEERKRDSKVSYGLSFLDEFVPGFTRQSEAFNYLKLRMTQESPEGEVVREEDYGE